MGPFGSIGEEDILQVGFDQANVWGELNPMSNESVSLKQN
jgi:hypothetical protein